jgi:glycosyltransferase involved in cell wall biosynthesis
MKLVIQIPCFNEEQTLPSVLGALPDSLHGVSEIEVQIIDDGSTDRTIEIAERLAVDRIIKIPGKNRRWLGRAFRVGLEEALRNGADIIVNTDGDNQYPPDRISDLIAPILEGQADVVVGNRHPAQWREFSPVKRFFQWLGNRVVSLAAGEHVPDAVSGFRAYSRHAALNLNITTNYTYTVDTLLQAYKKGLAVEWIEITPNSKTRESRLITSLFDKIRKSGLTILRIATVYAPFKIFAAIAILFATPGIVFTSRFFYYYFYVPTERAGHIQSVILGASCLVIAVQMFMLGIIAELLSTNRQIIEQTAAKVRELQMGAHKSTHAPVVPTRRPPHGRL